jgi:hypothetical protein
MKLNQVKPAGIKQMTMYIAPMAVETDIPPTHWLLDPHCKELPGMLITIALMSLFNSTHVFSTFLKGATYLSHMV